MCTLPVYPCYVLGLCTKVRGMSTGEERTEIVSRPRTARMMNADVTLWTINMSC